MLSYCKLVFCFHICSNNGGVMMNHEEKNKKCWRVVSIQKINRWSAKFSTRPRMNVPSLGEANVDHVSPLLVFWQANKGPNCLWAFKECIPSENTSPSKPPCAFFLWGILTAVPSFEASLFVKKNAQKSPLFPLISFPLSLYFHHSSSPSKFPTYP